MPFRMAESEGVAVVKVIGVGGGGGNAINTMVEDRLQGVELSLLIQINRHWIRPVPMCACRLVQELPKGWVPGLILKLESNLHSNP